MDIAKTRISAAEGFVTSHDAQLAACQQHLNRLYAEAQAADQAAQLVCSAAVTMHSPTLYPSIVSLHSIPLYGSSLLHDMTQQHRCKARCKVCHSQAATLCVYKAWDAGVRHSIN